MDFDPRDRRGLPRFEDKDGRTYWLYNRQSPHEAYFYVRLPPHGRHPADDNWDPRFSTHVEPTLPGERLRLKSRGKSLFIDVEETQRDGHAMSYTVYARVWGESG